MSARDPTTLGEGGGSEEEEEEDTEIPERRGEPVATFGPDDSQEQQEDDEPDIPERGGEPVARTGPDGPDEEEPEQPADDQPTDDTDDRPTELPPGVQRITGGATGPSSAIERAREAARSGRAVAGEVAGEVADIFREPEDFDVGDVFDDARRDPMSSEERRARNQLAAQSEFIDPADVVFVERDGQTVATVDAETARLLAASGFRQEDFIVEGGRVGETGGGEDIGFQGGDPASVALSQAERALEDAAEVDLDPQRDIEIVRTDGEFEARLTEEGTDVVLEDVERRLEEQIAEQTGREVDLQRSDFQVTETGEVELTQAGIDRVATEPLTDFVEGIGVDLPTFGEREIVPGPRAGAREREGTMRLDLDDIDVGPIGGPIAEDVGAERDFGKAFEVTLPVFGDRPVTPGRRAGRRPRVGTTTLDEVLVDIDESIADVVEPGTPVPLSDVEPSPGRAGAAGRIERRNFEEGQADLAQVAAESFLESPRLLISGARGLRDVGEFGVELATEGIDLPEFEAAPVTPGPRAARRPREGGVGVDFEAIDRLTSDAVQVAANQAAVGAAGAIESPAETAAAGVGTLAGSAILFGGAAAVGPRTGLATRGVIQPGEEALGFGGHAVTRRVAGRSTAERFFPNKEPLIFSEEAFLRGMSDAGGRAAGGARRARAGAVEFTGRFDRPTFGDFQALTLQTEVSRFTARQRMLEGPSAEVDIGGADVGFDDPVDVPTLDGEGATGVETDEPGDAGVVGGAGFDLEIEHRTPSGVAIEQVRVPALETEMAEFEMFDFETEAGRRRRVETAVGPTGIEGVGIEPIETPEVGFEHIDPFEPLSELETPGEIEVPTEVDVQPPRLDLRFDPAESEIEIEPGREVESETELETELFRREREQFDRIPDAVDIDVRTGLFEHRVPTVKQFEKQFREVDFSSVESPSAGRDRRRRGGDVDADPVEAPGIDMDLDLDLDDIDPFP